MKHWIAALSVLLVGLTDAQPSTEAPAPTAPVSIVEELPPAPPVPPLEVWTPSPDVARLTDYLEGLMHAWPHAAPSVPVVDFHAFAQDIAIVVLREPPAWDRTRFYDRDRSKTGVLMLTLAYWEGSRFAAYVDQDLCSSQDWRHSDEGRRLMHLGGDCDGTRSRNGVEAQAHSSWQIHEVWLPGGENCTRAALGDRQWAVHCALWIARASLRQHGSDDGPVASRLGTLANYTGEWENPYHPAADVRLAWARKQWRKHPFKP